MNARVRCLRWKMIVCGAVAGAAACGPRSPASPPLVVSPPLAVAAPVAAAVAAPPPVVDPYRAMLNLDFENVEAGQPVGWALGGAAGVASGKGASDAVVVHGGTASYRLTAGQAAQGAATVTLDATALRGKRVRLRGWVKTDAVDSGWAGVWLQVDRGATRFDNMAERGLKGTAEWREAVAMVDVPDDAAKLALGPLIVGSGTAWFDDLQIEVVETPKPHPVVVSGVAVDDSGEPVAGADVTAFDIEGERVDSASTGADGRFEIKTTSGRLSLSATKAGLVGGFVEPRQIDEDVGPVRLQLARAGGVEVVVAVVSSAALPDDVKVLAGPYSDNNGDVFALKAGPDGTFRAHLPRGERYSVQVWYRGAVLWAQAKRVGDRAEARMQVDARQPAPLAVAEWLSASAIRVATADPAHDLDDLKGIERIVGKARIVGLGEATHGTREFFQMKHRVVRYLVERMGFTVFAIEANLPECRAINDYVVSGKGDPQEALNGIHFWIWNTEEVLAMLEWMRAWNADPHHKRKVQFVGVDMQYTEAAAASVVAYVQRVAPAEAAQVATALQAEQASMRRAALPTLAARFTQMAKRWSKATGRAAYDEARQDLRVLEQEAAKASAGGIGGAERDRAMADNVDWLLAHQAKGARMALWAHNGHIANDEVVFPVMGAHLRQRYGKGYVALGFAFGSGSFQASDWTKGRTSNVIEHTLGPAAAHDVSAPFTQVGHPILIADLRSAPAGVVADWVAAPHAMRDTGYAFTSEAAMTHPAILSQLFDAVIFIDKTTRARPLPGGERPRRAAAPTATKPVAQ